jgi:lipid II:glycine glycyltransferase (peptidoglycan interpeptide bridge formation enzyme)
MVVDLEPSEEELLARMKGKTRYNIRLAARKGVEVTEPDDFEEAWEGMYRLSVITAERNGFPIRRSREYLHDVGHQMRAAGRAHIFFAEHEDDKLATMIVFTSGRKYWYMGGASIDEKRNLMPTYLLQWEVMKWAKERGMTYYDMMGIPSPDELNEDHPWYGVYKFKSGFGGEIPSYLGCLDLPVKPTRAKMWNRVEPIYYRLYQRLKGDIYY